MELPVTPRECAFDIESRVVCSPDEVVDKIRAVVARNGGKPIAKSSPKAVIDEAKSIFECESEACVLTRPEVSDYLGKSVANILRKYFKPDGPRDSDAWLSNDNIDEVLRQIATKFPTFLHIPFQMSDFANSAPSSRNLATINLADKYRAGMRTFGVVINTDVSSGRGKHWFAIFGDLSDRSSATIEYFNSAGDPPLASIQAWLDLTKHKLSRDLQFPVKVIVNRTQHQTDTHSCGPYALYYIISRQHEIPYSVFHNDVIPDEVMHEFRRHLFRPTD